MHALHFGAGNIGRGFIGKVLTDAGIRVTFIDTDSELIAQLNNFRQYPVKIVDEDECRIDTVINVDGVVSSDKAAIVDLISSVDLITTAVGSTVLSVIAPIIAKGLYHRAQINPKPINIIACENMLRGSTYLKEQVLLHLNGNQQGKVLSLSGFVDSVVDRIVPPVVPDKDCPLQVTVESFHEWIADETQFLGDTPPISGMERVSNLIAFAERKLFTLNTGHATAAYLGKLNNFKFIREVLSDSDLYLQVKGTMEESGAVLINRYAFDATTHQKYIKRILKRFTNPYLLDDVDRVGRQPLRKLSPQDRLIKPLLGTIEYGLSNHYIINAVVAALLYRNPDDPQAVELENTIANHGVKHVLRQYCGLSDEALIQAVDVLYQKQAND